MYYVLINQTTYFFLYASVIFLVNLIILVTIIYPPTGKKSNITFENMSLQNVDVRTFYKLIEEHFLQYFGIRFGHLIFVSL